MMMCVHALKNRTRAAGGLTRDRTERTSLGKNGVGPGGKWG